MIFPKFQAPWANWTTQAAGALALRIFLAMILIVQGLVKFDSADGKHTLTFEEVKATKEREGEEAKEGDELVAEDDYLVIDPKMDPLDSPLTPKAGASDADVAAYEEEVKQFKKEVEEREKENRITIPLHKDGKPDHFSPQYAYEWGMKTYGKLILEETSPVMMPREMVSSYILVLPWALLILGLMVLTGIFGRLAMTLSIFLFMSLAYGLFLIQDETAVFMILYVLLAANALFYSSHQRLGLTKL